MASGEAGPTTATALAAAAMAEFNEHGFDGTDTNRIARRAGFAPQTFYRWYKDKADVFVTVYRSWEEQEKAALLEAIAASAVIEELVDTIISHHRSHLNFRRSLRQLSAEDPTIREARAASRIRQVAFVRSWAGRAEIPDEVIAVALFQIERLSDAVAEGEFNDMRLEDDAARAEIAQIMIRLRQPPDGCAGQ
ncbi:AcrR family transcriptional regulator [Bradyrhizobium japonicum]|jgi:AcrR family transcriptional regulator|uniref:TetR/AcrR family transcriptional regulator n=1 Tax=Bradyrhizobium TaxID=374 RepID=UPI0004B09D42|nr:MULTISPECIES: TetR/AcrR family transcriptional regulator [Bradyrhizobium]MBR0948430.1 TetR/AcrR family transcriptional regulator [Bradyrhizobium liaoningense]MDI2077332.1 TetR/AcrR family transcriptional regulator [Bradyrhizobium sp. Mp27]